MKVKFCTASLKSTEVITESKADSVRWHPIWFILKGMTYSHMARTTGDGLL